MRFSPTVGYHIGSLMLMLDILAKPTPHAWLYEARRDVTQEVAQLVRQQAEREGIAEWMTQ